MRSGLRGGVPGHRGRRRGAGVLAAGFLAAATTALAWAAQAGPSPFRAASSEPVTFPLGIGRAPSPQELARVAVSVHVDGEGLPPGRGTAEEGALIYRNRCAACHGPDGHGTPAGWPLVGRNPGDAFDFAESLEAEVRRTIGNFWPYAVTLFDYTRRSMPMDRPGSLTADELYAVTAWMLWRNDLIPPDLVLDATSLPRVRMPAADRFIPDDRRRGRPEP